MKGPRLPMLTVIKTSKRAKETPVRLVLEDQRSSLWASGGIVRDQDGSRGKSPPRGEAGAGRILPRSCQESKMSKSEELGGSKFPANLHIMASLIIFGLFPQIGKERNKGCAQSTVSIKTAKSRF